MASRITFTVLSYPRLLYSFRYRDPLTGKWRKARYQASEDDIRSHHPEYELLGEPTVIKGPITGSFNPFRRDGSKG